MLSYVLLLSLHRLKIYTVTPFRWFWDNKKNCIDCSLNIYELITQTKVTQPSGRLTCPRLQLIWMPYFTVEAYRKSILISLVGRWLSASDRHDWKAIVPLWLTTEPTQFFIHGSHSVVEWGNVVRLHNAPGGVNDLEICSIAHKSRSCFVLTITRVS